MVCTTDVDFEDQGQRSRSPGKKKCFQVSFDRLTAGFPASGKIMETWKKKKKFQTWKNHGIWKKPQKPGIMEFEKVNMEKILEFFQRV